VITRPRVAIAHDYLTQRGGAERVVLALTRAFPEAPVYTTLFDPPATYPEFGEVDVRPSLLNRIGWFRRHHRAAIPVLPIVSGLTRIDADVVIASSSGWAHGFPTSGRKVVYCHTPARWLYERDAYLGGRSRATVRAALTVMEPWLMRWDKRAASTADTYLANSTVVRERIGRVYGRAADIVHPPHGIAPAQLSGSSARLPEPGYFLVVSRLLPYKNVDQVIEAFRDLPAERLLIVGSGPESADLRRRATPSITFLEGLGDHEMAAAYRGCRGLVAASYEDFGLAPLEAAAFGRPTAALRAGGYLDTVVEGVTGVFFETPDVPAIRKAVTELGGQEWDEGALTDRAAEFDEEHFVARMRAAVGWAP
jgi:glycosyltransferase involved in cell wall biosynthesis